MLLENIKQNQVIEYANSLDIYLTAKDENNTTLNYLVKFSIDEENLQIVELFELDFYNRNGSPVLNFSENKVTAPNETIMNFSKNYLTEEIVYKNIENTFSLKIAKNLEHMNVTFIKGENTYSLVFLLEGKTKTALAFFYARFLTIFNSIKNNQNLIQYVTSSAHVNGISLAIKPSNIIPVVNNKVTIDGYPNIFTVKEILILESNVPHIKSAIKVFLANN